MKNLNQVSSRQSKLPSQNKWKELKLRLEKRSKLQPEVEQKRADQANTSKLQVLSEAERLELYNQWDNVRITRFSEETVQSENRKEFEQEKITLKK